MQTDIPLEEWQIREIARCMKSPEYYIETFGWLEQKASAGVSESSGIIPFQLGSRPPTEEEIDKRDVPPEAQFWFQRQILRWLRGKEDVLAYKARRVGCSWIACAYAAWLITFHKGVKVVLVSRKEAEAKKMLGKVKFILSNLAYHDNDNLRKATKADWLKPHIEYSNQLSMAVGWRNDAGDVTMLSEIESVTTTDDSARGDDATFIVFDELAFYQSPDETWSSATKSMTRGGHWMAISTAQNIGDVFHRLVSKAQLAEAGKLEEPLGYRYTGFIHWSEAGMTEAQIERASEGDTQDKRDREWEGKFIAPGMSVFDPTHLAACYKPLKEYPEIAAQLVDYSVKVKQGKGAVMYFSGVDTIKGNVRKKSKEKDWNSWTSLTANNIQACHHYNQFPISKWAGKTVDNVRGGLVEVEGETTKLHREFPGPCYIENEGPGLTVVNNHRPPRDSFSQVISWDMKSKHKGEAIRRLQLKIESHTITITDWWTYQCMMVFQYGTTTDSYDAPAGFQADPVISLALASYAVDEYSALQIVWGTSVQTEQSGLDILFPDNELELPTAPPLLDIRPEYARIDSIGPQLPNVPNDMAVKYLIGVEDENLQKYLSGGNGRK